MGAGEEEDDGGLTPTEDDDKVQSLSGPLESVSALINRGHVRPGAERSFLQSWLWRIL